MAEVILMPRLSDTMTEGVVAAWHKNIGDSIKKGDLLAEIETDKATMELESYKDGILLHIGIAKGGKLQVNDLLAIIGKANEDISSQINKQVAEIIEPTKTDSQPTAIQPTSEVVETPSTNVVNFDVATDDRLKASPLAKKLAKEKGIDITGIQGSGDGRRIVKSDIDNFKPITEIPITVVPTINTETGKAEFTDSPNGQMRKAIAKRLCESKFSAPHIYLTMEINMDNTISIRTQMNQIGNVKISFQDMLIKACAFSLKQHPSINSSWMGDFIRTYHHVHIGSAVALPEGLIVPVIKFADQKSFVQIATETKELYAKAKNKKLQPTEFSGNTFTISNLGMLDIEEFTAIVNPPDSCILAVGKIKEIVVKKEDGFGTTNVMKVTLSCDHRSVDGAMGAAFLQTLKKYMENPITMLL